MILVDTNVIIDVLGGDPQWGAASAAALESAASRDELAIDEIVFAELAPGYDDMGKLEAAVATLRLSFAPIPKLGLFLAGQAFRRYRRSGGSKTNVLADFFIGAHAAVTRSVLLTRDSHRISTYFPTVSLVTPKAE